MGKNQKGLTTNYKALWKGMCSWFWTHWLSCITSNKSLTPCYLAVVYRQGVPVVVRHLQQLNNTRLNGRTLRSTRSPIKCMEFKLVYNLILMITGCIYYYVEKASSSRDVSKTQLSIMQRINNRLEKTTWTIHMHNHIMCTSFYLYNLNGIWKVEKKSHQKHQSTPVEDELTDDCQEKPWRKGSWCQGDSPEEMGTGRYCLWRLSAHRPKARLRPDQLEAAWSWFWIFSSGPPLLPIHRRKRRRPFW